jgi:hypothetical protein
LSNLATDYARKAREGLVAPVLFPRIPAGKPSGKYAVFDAEPAYKAPDVTMAGERSRATEFASSGVMKSYAAGRCGLKPFIGRAGLEFLEGPFKLRERRKTGEPAGKLELAGRLEPAQEKRIAAAVQPLSGRAAAPPAKRSGAAGNPRTDIKDAVEYRPKLLEKPGGADMIKKAGGTALGKLFRIGRAVTAKGRADFGKRSAAFGEIRRRLPAPARSGTSRARERHWQ